MLSAKARIAARLVAVALLVAPLVMVAVTERHHRPSRRRVVEAAALLATSAAAAYAVFLLGGLPYPAVLFPLVIWAPLRFRQLHAARRWRAV